MLIENFAESEWKKINSLEQERPLQKDEIIHKAAIAMVLGYAHCYKTMQQTGSLDVRNQK